MLCTAEEYWCCGWFAAAVVAKSTSPNVATGRIEARWWSVLVGVEVALENGREMRKVESGAKERERRERLCFRVLRVFWGVSVTERDYISSMNGFLEVI